jgi:hypothetical protein
MNYYVLGGIAGGALEKPSTEFDVDARQIIAAPDSAKPLIRPENDTVRDIDILIPTILDDDLTERAKAGAKAADTGLTVSIFGFNAHQEWRSWAERHNPKKGWLSRRTLDENGVHRYQMGPLQQEVKPESYEPWQLVTPEGHRVSTLSPAGLCLAYRMRSSSGLRYKDREKVPAMEKTLQAIPVLREEMRTGVFAEWALYARNIERLREGTLELDSPALRRDTTKAEVFWHQRKGRSLKWMESDPRAIKFAQSPQGEKLLGGIIGNK